MDILLKFIMERYGYNVDNYALIELFILIVIFAIVGLIIWRRVPLLFDEKSDTKKLVCNSFIIFGITLIATCLPTDSSAINSLYIDILKTIGSAAISFLPIYWSFRQCRKYWNKMTDEIDKEGNYANSIYPTLMVTQGTFYTFVGVASILFSYNTSGQQDISVIIGGLKLAFITSIIGMAYSIAAKNYLKNAAKKYIKEEKNNDKIPKILDEADFYKIAIKMNSMLELINKNIINLKDSNSYELAKNTAQLCVIENDVSTIEHLTDRIAESQEKLIHNLNEELVKSLNMSNETLEKNFTQLSNQMIESVKGSFAEINTTSKVINDKLQTTEEILSNINLSLNTVNDSSKSLENTFSEIISKYQNLNDGMNKAVSFLQETINEFKVAKDAFDSVQNSLVAYAKTIAENDPEKTVDAVSEILNTIQTDLLQHSECLKSVFNQSSEIYKNYQDELLNKLSDNQVKLLSSMNDNFDKLQELYRNTENKFADSNMSLAKEITDTISKYMQNYFEAINNQIEAIKEYTAHLDLVSTEADNQQRIIRNGHEGIVKEYELLSNDLVQKNSEYNAQMINAQERYNKMLEMNLSKAITVVSDVFKEARNQYIKDIQTITEEINKLSENNKDGDK